MDTIATSPEGTAVPGKSWKTEVSELLKLKQSYTSLNSLEIILPYGWQWGRQGVKISDNFSASWPINRWGLITESPSETVRTSHIILYTTTQRKRNMVGIKIWFPAKIDDAYIKRQPGFRYYWKDNNVKISKILGTTKPSQIEKQVKELLAECERFYFMYCSTN